MTALKKKVTRRKRIEDAIRALPNKGVHVTVTSSGSLSADPASYRIFVARKMSGQDAAGSPTSKPNRTKKSR